MKNRFWKGDGKVGMERSLYSYRRFVGVLFFVSLIILVFIFFVSIFNLSMVVKAVKEIKSVVAKNLNFEDEMLLFKNAKFTFRFPKGEDSYIASGSVLENESQFVSFSDIFYKMNDFKAEIRLFSNENNAALQWKENYDISSKFLTLKGRTISLSGDVLIHIKSNLDPKVSGIVAAMQVLTFHPDSHYINGEKIFIRGKLEMLKSKKFEAFLKQDLIKFWDDVYFENQDYKIFSDNLEVVVLDSKIKRAFFSKNVSFIEKGGNLNHIIGDNAVYDFTRQELVIYGNVKILSTENNLKAEAESFHYNSNTKIGNLKSGGSKGDSDKKIKVEIN